MQRVIEIRPAEWHDIAAMASIRAREWQNEDYWIARIGRYLSGEHHPQHALAPRAAWVAFEAETIQGFVAGHLTRRFGCDGELEWINVVPESRGKGIADQLLEVMLEWFAQRGASRICVNVEPGNAPARKLYAKHGAETMSQYWMIWKPERNLPGLFDNDLL